MLSEKEFATLEMTIGGIAITAGFFLLQLPLNWWPKMASFLIHLGISLGVLMLTSGGLLFLIGASRYYRKHEWQDRMVACSDRLRSREGFYMKAMLVGLSITFVVAIVWSALAQEEAQPHGPVAVDDARKCPKTGYIILDSNTASNGGVGYSFPADANICLVKNLADHNGVGYQIRPAGH